MGMDVTVYQLNKVSTEENSSSQLFLLTQSMINFLSSKNINPHNHIYKTEDVWLLDKWTEKHTQYASYGVHWVEENEHDKNIYIYFDNSDTGQTEIVLANDLEIHTQKYILLDVTVIHYTRKPFRFSSTDSAFEGDTVTFFVDNFTDEGLNAVNILKNTDAEGYDFGQVTIFESEVLAQLISYMNNTADKQSFLILKDEYFVHFDF